MASLFNSIYLKIVFTNWLGGRERAFQFELVYLRKEQIKMFIRASLMFLFSLYILLYVLELLMPKKCENHFQTALFLLLLKLPLFRTLFKSKQRGISRCPRKPFKQSRVFSNRSRYLDVLMFFPLSSRPYINHDDDELQNAKFLAIFVKYFM